jgi:hypothetical protein
MSNTVGLENTRPNPFYSISKKEGKEENATETKRGSPETEHVLPRRARRMRAIWDPCRRDRNLLEKNGALVSKRQEGDIIGQTEPQKL